MAVPARRKNAGADSDSEFSDREYSPENAFFKGISSSGTMYPDVSTSDSRGSPADSENALHDGNSLSEGYDSIPMKNEIEQNIINQELQNEGQPEEQNIINQELQNEGQPKEQNIVDDYEILDQIFGILDSNPLIGAAQHIAPGDLVKLVASKFDGKPKDSYILVSGKDIRDLIRATGCQNLVCRRAFDEKKRFSVFTEACKRFCPAEADYYDVFAGFCQKNIFRLSNFELNGAHLDQNKTQERLGNGVRFWAIKIEHLVEKLEKIKKNTKFFEQIQMIAQNQHFFISVNSKPMNGIFVRVLTDFMKIVHPQSPQMEELNNANSENNEKTTNNW